MDQALRLHEAVRDLDDSQWLDVLVGSLDGSFLPGVRLPSFPTNEETVGSIYVRAVDERALQGAALFVRHLKELLGANGMPLDEAARVLDIGCGWGRIYRVLMKTVSPAGLFGIDVDSGAIDLCKAMLPPEQFAVVSPGGALPFPDAEFDLGFANSVLSHLTADLHRTSVAEWARVLKPGGVLVATVMKSDRLEGLVQRQRTGIGPYRAVDFSRTRDELATAGFSWTQTGRPKAKIGYGLAFVTDEWLRANWPEDLPVTDVVTFNDHGQAFAVGRKLG